jgi:hypothetical protein
MRRRLLGSTVGILLLCAAAEPAGAEQYGLSAAAGPNGDSHQSNADPFVTASFSRSEVGGMESYEASADASSGSFYAKAARSGSLPFAAISTRGAASIAETLFIDEVPPGPIVVQATFGAVVGASSTGGFAHANASLRFDAFGAGSCTSAVAAINGGGTSDNSTCTVPGSSSNAGGLTLTLTPQQLQANNYEIYIDINASAQLESVEQIQQAAAQVGGGGGALLAARRAGRGTEPIPGVVYIEIDPPTAHSYQGSNTFFPVPEPGGPLLLAVGGAALGTARVARRRNTR